MLFEFMYKSQFEVDLLPLVYLLISEERKAC
jgi:hypothetical protein